VLLDDRAALVANCIGRSRQGIGDGRKGRKSQRSLKELALVTAALRLYAG
jgi:hypothetical protein